MKPKKKQLILFTVITTLLHVVISQSHAAPDDTFEPFTTWNGKKVYLSPARHSDAGSRGECSGTNGMGSLNENTAAYRYAYYAATGNYVGNDISTSPYRNLRSRGYKIRIGRGTISSAIANSNAWGATVHIPIHSNARPETCGDTRVERHGTHVIYQSYGATGGEGLSGFIKETVGVSSPGTNDLICHNSSDCTAFNCLGELCRTSAKAAYLEREFHTWNRGAKWIETDQYHAWRLGWAVDQFLGYPR
ncbi:hypothetical protein [Marinibactrum halimedae]|uniref:N-acetylmuramoyl-L-alanine amidase n=1 Tax=Marinibactrum halimedae TaxID=1444977 RepID=A0AA37WP56_9GAMM|nr:hypothetical protein [Marinibactrum halimedae]MCD9459461.1 hypothetical protein [Marinibactrum halimedae]GLS28115.1 hypothetical protein GCM10007877_38340 [Marinibactrum halimedae]